MSGDARPAAPAWSHEEALALLAGLEAEIGKVIVGQRVLIRRLLTGLFAAIPFATADKGARAGCGHILLEGVPGVAKTLTATTLARAIDARFQRLQLTPDMMPADIVGTRIYEAKTATFRIEHGPVFTNILLADEINRAPPKTQSALLEAMQERQVTLAERTFPLDDPFWVLATQNPIEQEGVYALPEAQLDRFSMMLRVEYPSAEHERAMLRASAEHDAVQPRVSPADVARLRGFIRDTVFVDDNLIDYIVRLGRATRHPADAGRPDLAELLVAGISPRSYQHVLALARVTAFMHGRAYVRPSDVKEIFVDATRHRIMRSLRAEAERVDADVVLDELLRGVAVS
ncbi:MAG TPA: AAA family ATPase [Vicinamibacterales bacterium]|jgi:MoxR-like ATPase|nr:AAA family ATPase [Vicinamibacterales bacterium]